MTKKDAIAAGLTVLVGMSGGGLALAADSDTEKALAKVRRATAKFHDVAAARAAGYAPVGECFEVPGVGGMGVHYLNERYAMDPAIAVDKPELLLYAPSGNGKLRLVGVEYFKADADQDLSTDDDRPSFVDQPFDGPMEGHGPGMPRHYDLHVWVWQANPDGTFAQLNPNVDC